MKSRHGEVWRGSAWQDSARFDKAQEMRILPEWVQVNYYGRELFTRLWDVADAARNYYNVARPEGIEDLEARATLRNALRRLEGDE